MAEYTVKAGSKFESITRKELDEALGGHVRSWVAETARGGRFTRFTASAEVASSAVTIGGDALSPAPGFVWDVRRLRIGGLDSSDAVSVYINDTGPAAEVASTADLPGTGNALFVWDRAVVLYPGEGLIVSGTGLTATGTITVSGQVLELPVGLAWKLT